MRQGRWWFALIYASGYLVGGLLLLTLSKRLPYRLGAGFLVATLYALSISVLLRLGLTGGGIPLLLACCVLSSLFFDVATAVMAILLGALAIAVVAAGMVLGFVPADPGLLQSSREAVAWVNTGVVYLLLARSWSCRPACSSPGSPRRSPGPPRASVSRRSSRQRPAAARATSSCSTACARRWPPSSSCPISSGPWSRASPPRSAIPR